MSRAEKVYTGLAIWLLVMSGLWHLAGEHGVGATINAVALLSWAHMMAEE